jgi:glucose/arabinose dehydrogenase
MAFNSHKLISVIEGAGKGGDTLSQGRPAMVTVFLGILLLFVRLSVAADTSQEAWTQDWEVAPGFSVSQDAAGFHLPSAIAFVPHPGSRPDDPLYFVTELRGKIKVVTNNRAVHTFADLSADAYDLTPLEELPSGQGQWGLAGICLEPKHGYVFVTFLYRDARGVMRNNIMRYQSTATTFSLQPTSQVAFTEVFSPYESGITHQIGHCEVHNELLYVGVGEAWKPIPMQHLNTMYGKIFRMTLDGRPVVDNPFYQDDDVTKAQNFVWAYGLRNPFALKVVDNRLFVAANGPNVDRFLEVTRGGNYFWDGTDISIATNAKFVWVPSLGPVQMDYSPTGSEVFPAEYGGTFFVSLTGGGEMRLPEGMQKKPGIYMLQYDLQESQLYNVPKYFLRYRGHDLLYVTGLAFGPDGLYFSLLYADKHDKARILKVTYHPGERSHPDVLQIDNPARLILTKGCIGCHTLDDQWDLGGTVGPPLVRGGELVQRLLARLNSAAYTESVKHLGPSPAGARFSFENARQEVLASTGVAKVKTWMKYFLQEPGFDKSYVPQMPALGLQEGEAMLLANYLAGETKQPAARKLLSFFPEPPYGRRVLAFSLLAGMVIGGGVYGALTLSWRRFRQHPESVARPTNRSAD